MFTVRWFFFAMCIICATFNLNVSGQGQTLPVPLGDPSISSLLCPCTEMQRGVRCGDTRIYNYTIPAEQQNAVLVVIGAFDDLQGRQIVGYDARVCDYPGPAPDLVARSDWTVDVYRRSHLGNDATVYVRAYLRPLDPPPCSVGF